MEYIKKEELIKGEVYRVEDGNFWMIGIVTLPNNGDNDGGSKRGNATYITSVKEVKVDQAWAYQSNYGRTYKLATPEEKHWLESCVKLDKFITFEEATKTFNPEYVECIKEETDNYFYGRLGKIYKVSNWFHSINDCMLEGTTSGSTDRKRFKPSTKEAYNAQFVVKEPEFVLPEKWCIRQNKKEINDWLNQNKQTGFTYSSRNGNEFVHFPEKNGYHLNTNIQDGYTEITFEQFKKYVLKEEIVEEKVIEPLPQFKVIETIETIIKVENNEGNQFFIGDVVISSNGTIQTIESFDYNKAKTNIIAFTSRQSILGNSIGIDKIEHYIEPKVEETLLEKAKRLYPVGTKFRVACNPKYIGTVKDHKDYPFQDVDIVNLNTIENIDSYTGMTVFYKGKWAEIIE